MGRWRAVFGCCFKQIASHSKSIPWAFITRAFPVPRASSTPCISHAHSCGRNKMVARIRARDNWLEFELRKGYWEVDGQCVQEAKDKVSSAYYRIRHQMGRCHYLSSSKQQENNECPSSQYKSIRRLRSSIQSWSFSFNDSPFCQVKKAFQDSNAICSCNSQWWSTFRSAGKEPYSARSSWPWGIVVFQYCLTPDCNDRATPRSSNSCWKYRWRLFQSEARFAN